MKRLLRALIVTAVVAVALGLPAGAAAACQKTTLGDVEDEVMCPVCGVPLELATEAPQAERERAFISEQIADCKSKEEIKDALVAQFGESVLATPGDDGFDLAAFLVPALALLVAGGGVGLAAVRWRRARGAAGLGGEHRSEPAGSAPDPDDAARLEADMRRYGI